MKKWLIGIIIGCSLLLIISVYFFIPEKLTFSESVLVNANPHGAYRCLTDKNQWDKLLGLAVTKNAFGYNGQQYEINEKTIDGIIVNIKNKDSFDSIERGKTLITLESKESLFFMFTIMPSIILSLITYCRPL